MGKASKATVRLAYIDRLKGLAMLMVVMGHLIVFCGLDYENPIIDTIVLVNMPLFLFLNGLVVREVTSVFGRGYLWKKFRQIMMPFLLWGGLITLFRHETYTNFLTSYWKFGYWYLIVLFEFYVITVAINVLTIKIRKYLNENYLNCSIFLMMVLAYFMLRFVGRFIPTQISVITDYYQALEYYPYFAFGLITKQFKLTKYINKYQSLIIALTMIAGLAGLYLILNGTKHGLVIITVRFLIITLALTLSIALDRCDIKHIIVNRSLSILSTIGRHTLAIYMIQFFFFRYINLSDLYCYMMTTGNTLALIFLITFCAVVLCYMCIAIEKLIDRSQYLKILIGK